MTILDFSIKHAFTFPSNNALKIRSLVSDFIHTSCSNNHHYQTMAAPYEGFVMFAHQGSIDKLSYMFSILNIPKQNL